MVAEKVLSLIARPPSTTGTPTDVHARLRDLHRLIPELASRLQGRVLDFGCGTGEHAIGIAMTTNARVTGLDTNKRWLEVARASANQYHTDVRFTETLDIGERFDLILSYNSMEHFTNPAEVLAQMRDLLARRGQLVISFSPPWLSPYGAHFRQIVPLPWAHLIFPERAMLRVRSRYYHDGATRYEDVEGGLNRMTIRKFERIVREAGLRFVWKRLVPTKRLPFVATIPGVRELLVTRVVCGLESAQEKPD